MLISRTRRFSIHRMWLPGLMVLLTFSSVHGFQPDTLTAADAKNHIGAAATVCGTVVNTRTSGYRVSSRGRPTILELDTQDPKQGFKVVVWEAESGNSGTQVADYKGKAICVTGTITKISGSPQIVASDPTEVHLQSSVDKSSDSKSK